MTNVERESHLADATGASDKTEDPSNGILLLGGFLNEVRSRYRKLRAEEDNWYARLCEEVGGYSDEQCLAIIAETRVNPFHVDTSPGRRDDTFHPGSGAVKTWPDYLHRLAGNVLYVEIITPEEPSEGACG